MSLVLTNSEHLLTLSDQGVIQSLKFRNQELLLPSQDLFYLGIRDDLHRNLTILKSSQFSQCSHRFLSEKVLLWEFFSNTEAVGCVSTKIEVTDHQFLFYPAFSQVKKGYQVEWLDAPLVTVDCQGNLFWPFAEGVLVNETDQREQWRPYKPLGFFDRENPGYYPGGCPMQFLAHYQDNWGVFFSAKDFAHGPKNVDFAPEKEIGGRHFSLQTFLGENSREYASPFPYVLQGFEGNWQSACEIYRNQIQENPSLPPKGNYPALVKDSPIMLLHPVQGHGLDAGDMTPNEYFPYSNALPIIEKYASLFDSKILNILMHWEGTAPWAPPYVWPPLGGEEPLAAYRDQLHARGHYLGLYCSGTAWTQASCINDYSQEKYCEEHHLEEEMIRGPHGEIKGVVCNAPKPYGQRFGYEMCIARPWCKKTVLDEIKKISDSGIDYAQFFDQNLGGRFLPCYSREHGHPEFPGPWQTRAMCQLLQEATKNSNTILGCEGAAAEPFISNLPFSDVRDNFGWRAGIPVAGYSFVYHEYLVNFEGNQCASQYNFDQQKSPLNVNYRIAYGFDAGNLLTAVLGKEGKILVCWGVDWEDSLPNQNEVITLIRNLNDFRIKYSQFMTQGKMLLDAIEVQTPSLELLTPEGQPVLVPGILHKTWESPEHQRAVVLTNYRSSEISVQIQSKDSARNLPSSLLLPPLSATLLPIL